MHLKYVLSHIKKKKTTSTAKYSHHSNAILDQSKNVFLAQLEKSAKHLVLCFSACMFLCLDVCISASLLLNWACGGRTRTNGFYRQPKVNVCAWCVETKTIYIRASMGFLKREPTQHSNYGHLYGQLALSSQRKEKMNLSASIFLLLITGPVNRSAVVKGSKLWQFTQLWQKDLQATEQAESKWVGTACCGLFGDVRPVLKCLTLSPLEGSDSL